MDTELATNALPATDARAPDGSEGLSLGSDRAAEATFDAVEQVLGNVEAALKRLDDGSYGRCGSCGEAIDDSHLVESPTARTCPACTALSGD